MLPKRNDKINKFVICTQDCSGNGWAKMLQDSGAEVILAKRQKEEEYDTPEKEQEDINKFQMSGQGITPNLELDEVLKNRNKYKDFGFIWDGNWGSEDADELRAQGFYVLGGHALTEQMENDREFGVSLIKKAGLQTPETQEFDNIPDALGFLDQNEDRAWIFKPNEPDELAWVTTLPANDRDDKANEEMYQVLQSFGEAKSSFILQERKKGTELNVEFFMYQGKPYFAHANFECKRKLNRDLGRLVGCAHDVEFVIPMDCKVLNGTLGKLVKLPEFKDYTGFLDMNIIAAEREYYFLEFCARFGYNSHPNLFKNLALHPINEIFSDMLTGNVSDFKHHFNYGFGASITMYIDDPVPGLPILIPEEIDKNFFYYDIYKEGDMLCLAGYSKECGIVCGHAHDIKSAADEVLANFNKIYFPGRSARTDIDLDNYDTNPRERYVQCEAMRLFEKDS